MRTKLVNLRLGLILIIFLTHFPEMLFPLVMFLDQKPLKIPKKKKEVKPNAVNRQADELEIVFFCNFVYF